jgi:RNA polymerase sigma-70 factor (ECF subfamily)
LRTCSIIIRLGQVRREKGRFRSFLLASLRNFLADQRDKAHAQKRGGQMKIISLDAQSAEDWYRLEPVHTLSPEKLFERRWALTILQRVLDRLEAEYAGREMQGAFHATAAVPLGRGRFRDLHRSRESAGNFRRRGEDGRASIASTGPGTFRTEIAATVATEDEIDEEVRNLSAVLAE